MNQTRAGGIVSGRKGPDNFSRARIDSHWLGVRAGAKEIKNKKENSDKGSKSRIYSGMK